MEELILESERSRLETLQTIEYEISKILQSHPKLISKESKILKPKKELSYKLNLIKQHELKEFINLYEGTKTQNIPAEGSAEFNIDQFDTIFKQISNENNDEIANSLISKYDRKKNSLISEQFESKLSQFNKLFTQEESYGLFLDLFNIYEIWLNLNDEKLSYLKYLEIFDLFDKQNLNKEHDYLIKLKDYLISFIERSKPLFNLNEFIKNLNYDNSIDFYCEICDKSFSKDTVFNSHKLSKKHLNKKNNNIKQSPNYLKFLIHQLIENLLKEEKLNTKLNLERKKALSERERIIELDHINSLDKEDINNYTSSEEEEIIEEEIDENNPMNLPIGPDGHPIPFWLYKLHGLGKEYQCEICGNFKYKGRKSFELHFNDTKHIFGLKSLGIQDNFNIYKDIIKIDQVLKLFNKFKKDDKQKINELEDSIQVEDEEGNVMSEKVYNDLKKQGLI